MGKLKNTSSFTDHFRNILKLTESQIDKIDEIEYDKYKAYFWNQENEHSLKLGLIRRIVRLLDEQQITELKSYKTDIIKQKKLKEDQELNQIIQIERKRLKDLYITENQLRNYALAKKALPKLAKEKMIQNAQKGILKISNDQVLKELENEHIIPSFTEAQSSKYSKIIQAEYQKKLESYYKTTKQRFEHDYDVKLEDHLVPLIYEVEENVYDDEGNIKSEFEQEEYKLEKYRKLLNTDQFHNYIKKYEQRIALLKQELYEINQKHLIYLERLRETYSYYLKNVLPLKIIVRKQLEKELTSSEKIIIKKLLKLYLEKLESNKTKALVQHQRYYKDLVPNEWEDYLIHHNFNIVRPNGYLLDGNELAIILLSEELVEKVKTLQSKLKTINQEYKNFQVHLYESTGGDYGGWLFKIPSPYESSKLKYLSLLLVEPNLDSILRNLSPTSKIKLN